MAAETSADAKVPVALALFKLSLQFSLQYLQEVSIFFYLCAFLFIYELALYSIHSYVEHKKYHNYFYNILG